MIHSSPYDLPFFDDIHRQLARELDQWMRDQTSAHFAIDESDDRAACIEWVRRLGAGGWLRWCVPSGTDGQLGGKLKALDSRALVVIRETLAYHSALADFAFAMQGLGSGAITLGGNDAQQKLYLPAVASGKKIAAFALSEPQAGSDVAAIALRIDATIGGWLLNGTKTWISNGGIADFYCVFGRDSNFAATGSKTSKGLSCVIVQAQSPGLDASEQIKVIAPHPLATLKFTNCAVTHGAVLGTPGEGFKLAMQTLDIFRASVAAAALGFARRAMAEAVSYSSNRPMFGHALSDMQLTQAKIGQMATSIDAGALLTYRAAWMRDVQGVRTTVPAAMAKLTATENAQKVIDDALQLHGGHGVRVGSKIESLYRDIRALRIYEGASEVQQLIIGKATLADAIAS